MDLSTQVPSVPLVSDDQLRARADELGVETSYWDVQGQRHHASPATLTVIVDRLEEDRLGGPTQVAQVVLAGTGPVPVGRLRDVELAVEDDVTISLEVHDGTVTLPRDLAIGCHRLRGALGDDTEEATIVVAPPRMPRDTRLDGRSSGLFVPAYALWDHDDPDPSYTHLRRLAAALGERGVEVMSTLPLYAAFLDDPFDPSPYAPVSRLHWNEAYVDGPGRVPGPAPTSVGGLIAWTDVARRRRHELLAAVEALDTSTSSALDGFLAARPDVADFARFRAGCRSSLDVGWPHDTVVRSYALGQFLAHRQLGAIEAATGTMLALDLPIGSHAEGYETHAHPELFASGIAVGAPPDELFADGQNWGFPPMLPGAGRRSGHDLWRRVVSRAGEHASILRIDHVMGVQRLWWIPDGHGATDGAYVRYPRDELLAVIAAVAARTTTTIIGEDLGTVSDEVRKALDRWDVIGLYEEQFHLDARPLARPGRRHVAGLRTHDMPAFASVVAAAPDRLAGYRDAVADETGRHVGDDTLVDAALERLADTDAVLVLADLDDLLGETTPHNTPGRVLPTNWRRRLAEPVSAVLDGPLVARRLVALADRSEVNA